MEKLGQLRARGRRRGPWDLDRRRHPAVAVGAGLPRRAQAARLVPRRPAHPHARRRPPRPAAGPTCGSSGPGSVRSRRADQCSARRCSRDLQTFVAALDTMFGGFRERAERRTRCSRRPGRRSSSWPRPSRTRCARRRTSSSGSPRSGCRWPGWCSTGCTTGAAARCPREQALAAAERLERVRRSTRLTAGAAARPRRAAAAGRPRAAPAWPRVHRGAPRRAPCVGGAGPGHGRRTTWTGLRADRPRLPPRAGVERRRGQAPSAAVGAARACARSRRGRSRAGGATT